jgi:hypothetical protein
MTKLLAIALVCLCWSAEVNVAGNPALDNPAANPPRLPLAQRITHNDLTRYRPSPSVDARMSEKNDKLATPPQRRGM